MLKYWLYLWAGAMLLGLIGVGERLWFGHRLANYGSYVTWGLWVAMYIYFIGLSAGAFLLSSLIYVFRVERLERVGKLSLLLALITLVMALLSIWFDLGHMGRVWRVYLTPNFSSMMAWMVWLYTAYFLLVVAEFWLAVRPDLVRWAERPGVAGRLAGALQLGYRDLGAAALRRDHQLLRILGTVGVPLAIAFHGGVGALFGVVGARPYWHSAMYPILFLIGALASGGALLTATVAFFWPERGTRDHQQLVSLLGRMTLGLLLFDLLLEWAEVSITLWGSIPSHVGPLRLLLFGPYWWVFWIVHLLFGALIPIALLAARTQSVRWIGIAATLIAVTFLSVRLNIVIPALAVPELEGLRRAYVDARLSFEYFPSLQEWLLGVFVVALGVALFYLGTRHLPIFAEGDYPRMEEAQP